MKEQMQEQGRHFADDAWWIVPIACAAAALAAVAIGGADIAEEPSPIPESVGAESVQPMEGVQTVQAVQSAQPAQSMQSMQAARSMQSTQDVQVLQTSHAIAPAAPAAAEDQPVYEVEHVQAF